MQDIILVRGLYESFITSITFFILCKVISVIEQCIYHKNITKYVKIQGESLKDIQLRNVLVSFLTYITTLYIHYFVVKERLFVELRNLLCR